MARHIDYGYTVESAGHLSTHRILLTGGGQELAAQQAALTKLNPNIRGFAIYTSDSSLLFEKNSAMNLDTQLAPAVEIESIGLGL